MSRLEIILSIELPRRLLDSGPLLCSSYNRISLIFRFCYCIHLLILMNFISHSGWWNCLLALLLSHYRIFGTFPLQQTSDQIDLFLRLSIERSRKCPQIYSVPLLPSLDNVFVRFSIARCLLALQFVLLHLPQSSNPIDLFPRKHIQFTFSHLPGFETSLRSLPWLRFSTRFDLFLCHIMTLDLLPVFSMATIINSWSVLSIEMMIKSNQIGSFLLHCFVHL